MINETDASSMLTKLEVEAIEEVTYRTPDRDLTFSQVIPIRQLPNPDAETGFYYVADTDDGSAELIRSLRDAKKIFISNQKVTYSVYTASVGWDLKMSDIRQSRSWGVPLDTENVRRATRAVQEKMNSFAYVGDSTYGIAGLFEISGPTSISGNDMDSTTDVAADFIGYFNSLPVKYRTKYNYTLLLADQEWAKLQKPRSVDNDKSAAQLIVEAIPNLTISTPEQNLDSGTTLGGGGSVSDGTAYLIPKNEDALRMPLAQSPRTTRKEDTENEEVSGKVLARMGPVNIIEATSIGKITGLNG